MARLPLSAKYKMEFLDENANSLYHGLQSGTILQSEHSTPNYWLDIVFGLVQGKGKYNVVSFV